MKKIKEVILYNPNDEKEKILVYKTYSYFYVNPGETCTIEVETDKELKHYKESAKIHDLDFKIQAKTVEENVENEEDEQEDVADEVEEVESDIQEDQKEEEEIEVEEETKEEQEIEEVSEELEGQKEIEDDSEEDEEVEVAVDSFQLNELEEKLHEFKAEDLQELADKYDITTYNAKKKETLIKWIVNQADQLPLEDL